MSKTKFVPYGKRETFLLTNVPEGLRLELRVVAEAEGTSMTDLVVGILSERYELGWTPSGRALRSDFLGGRNLSLRLPPAVFKAVKEEGDERGVAMRSVIMTALCERFSIDPPEETKVDPARRRGRPRKHGQPRGRGRSKT